jgi:hypothetical protein
MRIGGLAGSADPFAGLEGGVATGKSRERGKKQGYALVWVLSFLHAQAPDEGSGLFDDQSAETPACETIWVANRSRV